MKSFMEIGPHVFRNPEHRHTVDLLSPFITTLFNFNKSLHASGMFPCSRVQIGLHHTAAKEGKFGPGRR